VHFVGALKVGGDGLIELLFLHGGHLGKVFSLLLTAGCPEAGVHPVSPRS
jgi:hypothetical protein